MAGHRYLQQLENQVRVPMRHGFVALNRSTVYRELGKLFIQSVFSLLPGRSQTPVNQRLRAVA